MPRGRNGGAHNSIPHLMLDQATRCPTESQATGVVAFALRQVQPADEVSQHAAVLKIKVSMHTALPQATQTILGGVHDDDGGVVELNGPAIGVLADLEDVQGAVVVDADPDEGPDGETGPEDRQADGDDFLVGLDLHVLAEEHADDE
eukprot:CAMPEP_0203993608 /NCGR_PEP_ID=MMETSP0360-20130528/10864_1 /ASSEMBLY_ACC=CAM_ASM_000342 /TAXON_ID=268821 /ORGANISM="Scrippsiella Hangoei, Strain SHTV-5" /LENGTH=146 /DNA_ID=CAMNT_0050934083 /DNA_START=120 /DNA_END=556 /DNA_ORIENTATION=+